MAQKVSVFTKLNQNFQSLYQLVCCAECKRKIDVKSKCFECDKRLCAECLHYSKRTNTCKSCKTADSIKATNNKDEFLNDLVNLIKLFDEDTGQKTIKENFFNVETSENLEKMITKNAPIFQQQKLFATSTPNVDNTKKVVFNSDITMIPNNNNKQIESVEKVNTRKRNVSNSDKSSSITSKRKADSMNEKSDQSSRSKKAKLDQVNDEEKEINEQDNVKENCNDDEMELDKQANRKNLTLQNKDKDDNQELINKKNSTLQNKDVDNRQNDENRQLLNEKYQQALQLNEKHHLDTLQLMKDQLQEFNNNLNTFKSEKLQEMFLTGLTKIVSNCTETIQSSIQIENIGKINFTIEPFKKIELPKKEFKTIEIQTDNIEKLTTDQNLQTSLLNLYDKSTNTDAKESKTIEIQCELMELDQPKITKENENKITVNNVDDGLTKKLDNNLNEKNDNNENKQSNFKLNGTNNKSNFSIQFDDSERALGVKEMNDDDMGDDLIDDMGDDLIDDMGDDLIDENQMNNDNELKKQQKEIISESTDKIDSDELKKNVENSSILDDIEDSDDELGPSSPICD